MFFSNKPKLSTTNKIVFLKRLSFLIQAGIPLSASLDIISKQSPKNVRNIFNTIIDNVNSGKSFSESLAIFPSVFPEYIVQIVLAGEQSGTLHIQVSLLATELGERQKIVRKFVGSLLYPAVIFFGTISLSIFLVFAIFPKVKNLFQSLHVDLPISTKVILFLSDTMHSYGLIFLFIFSILVILFFFTLRKNPKLQYLIDQKILFLPFIGKMIVYYNLSIFFRTLGIMLQSSLPIEKSIELAKKSIGNRKYVDTLSKINEEVKAGNTISSSLKNFPNLFPDTVFQLTEIGEKSGTLKETCAYISDILEQENENTYKTILTFIEPALMIFMGLVVGFISLSIITPVYEITQNIKH